MKYASKHGMTKAVRRFEDKSVKESTVRDWKKAYEKELKEHCKCAALGDDVQVKVLPGKTRGRPPLVDKKLDKYLQELIVEMHS